MDGEETQAAEAAYAALAEREWPRLQLLLHPYLHWTDPDGVTIRGRVKVLEVLAHRAEPPDPADSVELRNGQIYRWHSA